MNLDEIKVYNTCMFLHAIFPVLTTPVLLFIPAPYGRFTEDTNFQRIFGFKINGSLGFFIQEIFSPTVFISSYLYPYPSHQRSQLTYLFAILWLLQYVNRAIIYPFVTNRKMRPTRLVTVLTAIYFNSINGYLNGRILGSYVQSYDKFYLGQQDIELAQSKYFVDPYNLTQSKNLVKLALGLVLFTVGAFTNNYHDILIQRQKLDQIQRLKVKTGDQSITNAYVIPKGGLFKYISSPNFFGEIIQWAGWAIMTQTWPGFLFMTLTAANLIPRAIMGRRWYNDKFKDEMESRKNWKAVIPFIL